MQSLVTVGAIFGGPISGWAIDKFGRKGSILLCAVPFELGWLLISNAQNRAMLYAGRVITGVACGMISLAVPVSSSRGEGWGVLWILSDRDDRIGAKIKAQKNP